MKFFLSLISFLFITTCFGQQSNPQFYPEKYTLEAADKHLNDKNLELSTWFLINLFPERPFEVLDRITRVNNLLSDTSDIRKFILKNFVKFATADPTCVSSEEGKLMIHEDVMFLKGEYGDALIAYFKPDERQKTISEAYNLRALNHYRERDLRAIPDFDSAIILNPKAKYIFNRAYALSDFEQFEAAIKDYDRCEALNYKPAETYFERGYCNMKLERDDEALKNYQKAIKLEKNYIDAHNNMGIIYLKQSEFKKAFKIFDKVVKMNPDLPNGYMNRGFAYFSMDRKEKACSDWNTALKLGFQPAQKVMNENCN